MKVAISFLVAVCVAVIAALIAGALAHGLAPVTAWASLLIGGVAGTGAWCSMTGEVRSMRALRALVPNLLIGNALVCESPIRKTPEGNSGFPVSTANDPANYATERGTASGQFPTEPMPPVRGWVQWSVVAIFTLFALRAFCWLVYFKEGDVAFLSPNNLGDLSLHLTYTRYLANGARIWPENPIYSGTALHYPFGVDLLNSLLTLAGLDLYRGLVWVGLLGAAATGVMLWRWGGAFALAGFLFNGGIAGFGIFTVRHLADFQDPLAWKSIPLALFITQRGLLYAIPAGLALLWSWQTRLLRHRRGLPFWVEVLLYATMPIFHLHTFIFLSAMLAWWLVVPCRVPVRLDTGAGLRRREVLKLIGCAFLPASALVFLLTGGFQSGQAIHLKPGWMQGDEPLRFWFENFGFLPLAVAGVIYWISCAKKNPALAEEAAVQSAVVWPALLMFILACFVMFAPWEWDNTKLMIWSYLAVLPAIWAMLRNLHVLLRAAACTALFFSGFISLLGGIDGTHRGFTLAHREELDALSVALKSLSSQDKSPAPLSTFACVPTYNHPLLLLGCKVVAGYDGHLMSHGIDYRERFATLDQLMRGAPGWAARAASLGVDYLYWGEREQSKYPESLAPWTATAPVVAQGTWGTIYDLRKRRNRGTQSRRDASQSSQ
ncbi:MAG: hypothetical protein WCP06_02155 [Verrucomicrobiota bacterium]